ncbi:MAG: poly-gamma-glutamate biosynthesis protein PgsC/CapC [Corynebacterium sp.]|nr:poly-gamma-glutamate biosynthesis protein PgsC/CapC [Corynebacterium sp.]
MNFPGSNGEAAFITDYVHLAFLSGLLLSYIYYRYRHISLGGTLAVGYLAAAAYSPINVIMTVLIALTGWAVIRFGVLKIALPNSRQLFAIGLLVGVVCGLMWIMIARALPSGQIDGQPLEIIGVIIPGMICNSMHKQGVRKTVLPMVALVPSAAIVGLILTYLSNDVFAISGAANILNMSDETLSFVFGLSAISVLLALLIQYGTYQTWQLRTGGYVTVGILIALSASQSYWQSSQLPL